MQSEVDLLYLAWERQEFTDVSFAALQRNTDWTKINKLYIYSDAGSSGCCYSVSCESWVNVEKFGSPVAIMNDFLKRSMAEIFVKLDNDVIVPPGWLEEGLRLMAENPKVDLLGIEAYSPVMGCELQTPADSGHGIKYTTHVGGIGLFRRRAFEAEAMRPNRTYFGFTEFMWSHPEIIKAWVNPPMKVFLLDHIPIEPFMSLSVEYEAKGWQRRQWGLYPPEMSALWSWWKP